MFVLNKYKQKDKAVWYNLDTKKLENFVENVLPHILFITMCFCLLQYPNIENAKLNYIYVI